MPSTVKRLHTWLKPGGLLAYNTLQVASCYLCIRQIHLSHALHATLKATNNAPLAFLTNAQLQQHHCNFTFKLAFRSREYLKQALIIWTDTGSICRHHSRHYWLYYISCWKNKAAQIPSHPFHKCLMMQLTLQSCKKQTSQMSRYLQCSNCSRTFSTCCRNAQMCACPNQRGSLGSNCSNMSLTLWRNVRCNVSVCSFYNLRELLQKNLVISFIHVALSNGCWVCRWKQHLGCCWRKQHRWIHMSIKAGKWLPLASSPSFLVLQTCQFVSKRLSRNTFGPKQLWLGRAWSTNRVLWRTGTSTFGSLPVPLFSFALCLNQCRHEARRTARCTTCIYLVDAIQLSCTCNCSVSCLLTIDCQISKWQFCSQYSSLCKVPQNESLLVCRIIGMLRASILLHCMPSSASMWLPLRLTHRH